MAKVMIRLLADRYAIEAKEYEKRVFLHAGLYPLIKTIPNLGWMVRVSIPTSAKQTSIIRFSEGAEE